MARTATHSFKMMTLLSKSRFCITYISYLRAGQMINMAGTDRPESLWLLDP